MTGIVTGIPALDSMLFGDEYYREPTWQSGFRGGEVALIRGEPGSGKTTLGLQIASNYLRAQSAQGASVQFMTLEEPASAMAFRCRKYGFADEGFTWIEREKIDPLIEDARRLQSADRKSSTYHTAASKIAEEAIKALSDVVAPSKRAMLDVASLVAGPAIDLFLTAILGLLIGARPAGHADCPRLVVIDSLNALMNLLVRGFPSKSGRLLFNTFCQVLRQYVTPSGSVDGEELPEEAPVILIIGEHHFHEPDTEKYLPESFFCDTEIVLRPEPIRLPRDSDPATNMTLGYDLAAIVEPDANHLESRSFCRVIKSRCSPRQSRRCAYDIESGEGFRFFETYPGDGKLMLFAENEQQRSAWNSFFHRDLTDAYPALRYETFTMEGLETVYESSRRLLRVPLRTDMYLSSLDSYWVTGYRDYRLKKHINDRLRAKMRPDWRWTLGAPTAGTPAGRQRSPLSTWICMEYPAFVNDLVYYSLTKFECELYRRNRIELSARPGLSRFYRSTRLEERLSWLARESEKLWRLLRETGLQIAARYQGLGNCLFGKNLFDQGALEKLAGSDELPDRLPDILPGVLPEKYFGETLLRPLPRSQLTLYGQYNADVLPSLVRENMHQLEDGEDYWLSIPYDANIGVFVARFDLLGPALEGKETQASYLAAYHELKQQEHRTLAIAYQKAELLLPKRNDEELGRLRERLRLALEQCERELHEGPGVLPTSAALAEAREARLTWDQVISLCAATDRPLGLETRSFDTMMATFLELVWNCGGRLEVNGRYQVCDRIDNTVPLLRALHYFGAIFKHTRTPRDQTVDPCHFHPGPGGLGEYGDWLFARYWYSTLLDAVTATQPIRGESSAVSAPPSPPAAAKTPAVRRIDDNQPATPDRCFVWQAKPESFPPSVEIILMPKGTADRVDHYTCWGDWSFGLLQGSENVALACDLVSNLMGDQKVTDRGLRGACLPTVSQFYWRYRNEPCVPVTIRDDMKLPRMTFGRLGSSYLGTPARLTGNYDEASFPGIDEVRKAAHREPRPAGIFRQSIFDYRHCAREIFGEILRIKRDIATAGASGLPDHLGDATMVVVAGINMLRGIEELRHRYISIRDSFRHDVAEVALQDVDRRRDWGEQVSRKTRIALRPKLPVAFSHNGQAGTVCDLVNVSPGGCCLEGVMPPKDSEGDLIITGATQRSLLVAWRGHGMGGCKFKTELQQDEYYELLTALSAPGGVAGAEP